MIAVNVDSEISLIPSLIFAGVSKNAKFGFRGTVVSKQSNMFDI